MHNYQQHNGLVHRSGIPGGQEEGEWNEAVVAAPLDRPSLHGRFTRLTPNWLPTCATTWWLKSTSSRSSEGESVPIRW